MTAASIAWAASLAEPAPSRRPVLDPEWLASRLGALLQAGAEPTRPAPAGSQVAARRLAGVLVPIVLAPEPFILLTKRSTTLRNHPGQVSFPGGRIDGADANPEAAALREAEEEIALPPDLCRVIGRLPGHVTSSDFHVTPVVALVRAEARWVASPAEVEAILTLPVSVLLDPDAAERKGGMFRGEWHEWWVWRHPEHLVWGATAAILMSLAEILRGAVAADARWAT